MWLESRAEIVNVSYLMDSAIIAPDRHSAAAERVDPSSVLVAKVAHRSSPVPRHHRHHRPEPRLLLLAAAVASVAAPRQPPPALPRVAGRLRRPGAPVRNLPGHGAAPGAATRRARSASGWPAGPRSTSTHRASAGLRLARHSGWATAGQVPLGLRRTAF